MRKFIVPTRPFDDDMRLYLRKEVTFNPGLTTLIGCNGSGKTTLMMLIKDELRKDNDILLLSYDDRFDGQSNLMSALGFRGDTTGVINMFTSSEGERIIRGVGYFAQGIRKRIQKANPKEIWILLDAVGSGLSIDGIRNIKDLARVIIEDNQGTDVYFVVSTNEYEFTIDADNIDVTTFRHKQFKDYDDYRNYILKTAKKKEKRYKNG